ncbi:hypothetical protein N7454_000637 [Penicillium verhagenii]|nr:hypothetical protein N7454_000637 [Penicillium verhagenii]
MMIPHRSTALLAIIVFVALLLFIFSSSPIPNTTAAEGKETVSGPAKYLPQPHLPSLSDLKLPTFRAPSHEPPPVETNSTSGESKWFSNWEWLNPFSSAITLDEDRSVLPPLHDRRPIYTYYNPKYNPKNTPAVSRRRIKMPMLSFFWPGGELGSPRGSGQSS